MSQQAGQQSMKRTYEIALKLLNSRRRNVRPTDVPISTVPSAGENNSIYRGTPSILGMREWLEKLGYTDTDIASLNIIHVAGTKGKGSTCAFARSLLHQRAKQTGFPKKIGLYTSPDLISVRERIQLDGKPISEELFTHYFFEVWDRLFPSTTPEPEKNERQPRYLQLLFLLALHTFAREGAQATILETHHGGQYDATNVITQPVVTGVTSIGLDHVFQLGPNIENIAWHKAGIFKNGCPAFSAPQVKPVADMLQTRAAEIGVQLQFVDVDSSLPNNADAVFANVQRINCSLAIALVNSFLHTVRPSTDSGLSQEDIRRGIEDFSWPGRFEIIRTDGYSWFIDGAHNELSIGQAVQWFAKALKQADRNDIDHQLHPCTIVFAHISEERDGIELLRALAMAVKANNLQPDNVIFTTYQERQDGELRIDKILKSSTMSHSNLSGQYSEIWRDVYPMSNVAYKHSIEEALQYAKELGTTQGTKEILITGSLYLVGGALHLLRGGKLK